MAKVVIDFNKGFWPVIAYYEKAVTRGMRKALLVLMAELKALTPEDTKEMLASYRMEGIKKVWNNIVGTISNDAWHAIFVEYGVGGLTYNYHKPKGSVVYRWQGNRTFARAMDNKRNEILQIIANEIW